MVYCCKSSIISKSIILLALFTVSTPCLNARQPAIEPVMKPAQIENQRHPEDLRGKKTITSKAARSLAKIKESTSSEIKNRPEKSDKTFQNKDKDNISPWFIWIFILALPFIVWFRLMGRLRKQNKNRKSLPDTINFPSNKKNDDDDDNFDLPQAS